MVINIDGDFDRDDFASQVGATVDPEDLRTSDSRRKRLQSSSQRRTREWGLSVEIDPKHQTAQVAQRADKPPKVTISGRKFDQPVSDLDDADWDWVAQKALGWHEDGHVLYTASEDFKGRLKQIDKGDKGTAKQLWNALEDGAIELQIARRWSNAYPLLRLLRANLFGDNAPGMQDVERGGRVFPVAHATQSVLLAEWMDVVYDIEPEVKDKLVASDVHEYHFNSEDDRQIFVDEILPLIETVVPDVLSIGNGVDRNQRIFEFIHNVLPHISDSKADGKSQMNRDEDQSPEGMPDDATEGHSGEAREDADELEEIDGSDIEKITVHEDAPDEVEPVEVVDLPDDVEIEIADDVSSQQQEEAGVGGDLLDELEEISDVIDSGNEDLQSDSIEFPTDNWDADEATYDAANQASKVLAKVLKNRLQSEESSEVKRHQRRGRYTGRGGATTRAARGESRVKERVIEPKEKDYHFVFVLDRSTSMRQIMSKAEEALGMLALALEEVGVDVMIVELYNNRARLAKPFGTDVKRVKGQIFNSKVSGGTPISGAIELSRERLLRAGDNKYMVVVTDGAPNDTSAFERAIGEATMPTVGINLTDKEPDGMGQYDRSMKASPGGDLQQALTNLVQEVMF